MFIVTIKFFALKLKQFSCQIRKLLVLSAVLSTSLKSRVLDVRDVGCPTTVSACPTYQISHAPPLYNGIHEFV